MRILTVCTSTHVFGAEVITLKLLEGFKKAGHEQLAVTTIWTDGEFNRRLAAINVPEVRLPFGFLSKVLRAQPMWWTTKVVAHLPVLWVRWSGILRRFDPEVILFTNSRQAVLVFPWLTRRRSFLVEHTYLEPTDFRRFLFGRLARKLERFVTVSGFMGEHLWRVGIPREKLVVIRNGPLTSSDRAASEPQWNGNGKRHSEARARITVVGQISANKGYDFLIRAAAILKRTVPAFTIRVFGSGDPDYLSGLQREIEAAGLSGYFVWMGYTTDKNAIYGACDVCVVPSQFDDPFPTVAIEAGAYGLAVIATRRGGLPEIVEDGVTGWLIDPDVPEQLAERLAELIADPVAARRMGSAAREKVYRDFTQERMVLEWEELFRQIPAQ